MYLFDTNVVSALRRREREPARFNEWASNVTFDVVFVSVVTVMEIEQGIIRLERRDARQGATLRHWFKGPVLEGFRDRILPVDLGVARRAAALHVPDPRPIADALIAATALVHDLIVVTRNARDFAPTGAPVLDPWASEA
jgi:predicted nucleic acid-binding protein